jgi:hypothetical protein
MTAQQRHPSVPFGVDLAHAHPDVGVHETDSPAVLGSRMVIADHRTVAAVLLALAASECAVVVRSGSSSVGDADGGVSFVLAVAAEAVALLSASLAVPYHRTACRAW